MGEEDEALQERLRNMLAGARSSVPRSSVGSRVSADTAARSDLGEAPSVRISVGRSDSDLARELAAQLDAEHDSAAAAAARRSVEQSDARAAAALARELNRSSAPRELNRSSVPRGVSVGAPTAAVAAAHPVYDSLDEDANMAAAMAEEERMHEEAVMNLHGGFDYVRPNNYKPWFCRGVVLFTSVMMFAEIGANGWRFESPSVNPLLGPSLETLDRLGAKNTPLILDGQFYRLFTPVVLHAGLLHLLFNMLGLWNVGFPAEREFGPFKIGSIFLASGVMGVTLSAIMVPQQLGVGASGAIFGLFGAAWADLIQNWSLYKGNARCILTQLSLATVVNLGIGLVPFLDNFAHFGGFVTGLVMGFTMLTQNTYDIWGFRQRRRNYQLLLQALAITFLPVLFVVLLLVLYLQVDVNQTCDWCNLISCVPMPPGAAREDLWWDCSTCSTSPEVQVAIPNPALEDYVLTCPGGGTLDVLASSNPTYTASDIIDDNSLVLEVCKLLC